MCSYRIRELLPEPRALPVARDGDVREPRALLAAPGRLGESGPGAADVVEGEHRRAASFAIAIGLEPDLPRGSGSRPQAVDDRRRLARTTRPEEDERDVQMLPRDDADVAAGERSGLPRRDRVEPGLWEAQREKEAKSLTAADASRRGHTTWSRLRVSSVRTR